MIGDVKALIRLHEGEKAWAYQDSLGLWTIGVGHLIDHRKGGSLPPEIIEALFEWDVAWVSKLLDIDIPWWRTLDPVRQAVLQDMTFNLGDTPFNHDGVNDWPRFVKALEAKDFAAAAQEMRNTKWASQVKTRADRLISMMESGAWPAQ